MAGLACAALACSGTSGPGPVSTYSGGKGLAGVETCESILVTTAPNGAVTEEKHGCTSHQSEGAEGSDGMWATALQALSLGISIFTLAK